MSDPVHKIPLIRGNHPEKEDSTSHGYKDSSNITSSVHTEVLNNCTNSTQSVCTVFGACVVSLHRVSMGMRLRRGEGRGGGGGGEGEGRVGGGEGEERGG